MTLFGDDQPPASVRMRSGWTRAGGVGHGSCGCEWLHNASGWLVKHCGHPTALHPYYGVPPAGGEILLAPTGYAFNDLIDAQIAVELKHWRAVQNIPRNADSLVD